ncbi:hypothetical protein LINGRAHAP2_LOCUS24034 [Linum grandiflorum]
MIQHIQDLFHLDKRYLLSAKLCMLHRYKT